MRGGQLGVRDLLTARVGPDGEVVGLEREARLVALGERLLRERDPANVGFVLGAAYASGLPSCAFDLAHACLLLINLTDPGRARTEMVALVGPGRIVAVQDIDPMPWPCEPLHPAWDPLVDAFLLIWRANGLPPLIGRRLPATLRATGLVDGPLEAHARTDPPGAYPRKHLRDPTRAIRREIVERRLSTDSEPAAPTGALERHLDDPCTVLIGTLLFLAWGRKAEG